MRYAILLILTFIGACASDESVQQVEELMPLTAANMRGHKHLYEDGWLLVSSTEKSFAYARDHMGTKSTAAMQAGAEQYNDSGRDFVEGVKRGGTHTGEFLERSAEFGAESTKGVFVVTHNMAKSQIDLSGWLIKESGVTLWEGAKKWPGHAFDAGETIVKIPQGIAVDTYRHVGETIDDTNQFNGAMWRGVSNTWNDGMHEASAAHREGVKRGNRSNNSLVAIFPVMWGNAKSAYHALVRPTVHTGVASATSVGSYVVFVPTSAALGTAWYATKHTGYGVYKTGELAYYTVAPPVTAAAMGTGSAFAAATVPVTYAAGSAVGATYATALAGGTVAGSTAYIIGNSSWELVKLTGKGIMITGWRGGELVFHQVSSVVVLGYNAATALPTHSLMAVTDTMCIAVYDGPHAVMQLAKGE